MVFVLRCQHWVHYCPHWVQSFINGLDEGTNCLLDNFTTVILLTIVLECFHLVSLLRILSRLMQENRFLQQNWLLSPASCRQRAESRGLMVHHHTADDTRQGNPSEILSALICALVWSVIQEKSHCFVMGNVCFRRFVLIVCQANYSLVITA